MANIQQNKGNNIPLECSSYEFMVALMIASLIQMIPNWMAYTACWVVLAGLAVYFCCCSRGTIDYGNWRKFFLSLCCLTFIFSIAYSQVLNRYREANIISPSIRYMTDYGGVPPYDPLVLSPGNPPRVISGIPSGVVTVDGRLLDKYTKKINVMVVAFHIINSEDFMDKTGICKSKVVKIRPEDIHVRIDFNAQFLTEIWLGATGVNYMVLAVPIGMKPEDFNTLNDAVEKGAQVIDHGATGGPPNVFHDSANKSAP
jgi:hypothetical protein